MGREEDAEIQEVVGSQFVENRHGRFLVEMAETDQGKMLVV